MYNTAFDSLNAQAASSLYLDEGLRKETYLSARTLVERDLAKAPETLANPFSKRRNHEK